MATTVVNGITILDNPTGTGAQLLMNALEELANRTDATASSGVADVVIVGAGNTSVLGADTARQRVVLTNDGTERIDIAIGVAAVLNKGISLAVGSAIVLTPTSGCRLAINAICASGGMNLAVQILSA